VNQRAILYALASSILFGLSTPAAKALLGDVSPIVLAGLLYAGAGIGMTILRSFCRWWVSKSSEREAALERTALPWLAGATVAGGVIGPILLMIGLANTRASTASLLLTLEGAATALLAWFLFRENFDRRVVFGMATIVAGAAVLAWSGTPTLSGLVGPLAIVGACVAWALDNNLTRKLSLSDPLRIVELKGLIAGPINVAIGLIAGGALPSFPRALSAGVVGFLGYGVSIALFVRALRDLGTARTGAYFSTAPFFGAIAAVLALGEPLTLQLITAGALMAVGVWLHLTEHHDHEHVHELTAHAHRHRHDEHHQHEHEPGDPPVESHTHWHEHSRASHTHRHVPDAHHRHGH
jgi:drug/metabolite transporter (DMT)-like permease